ncbi:MAG: ATP-binding cassette domain-containing protein [Gammaproteobacteria bacterium]|nr:ATP-binding cassette domain-containing protein [Gammaproteobacteria bacterium]
MLLEVRNLKTHFAIGHGQVVHAVDGVSLNIAENEILGLVGESGCGKSTLGRTLAGLQPKTSGDIIFHGKALPNRYSVADFRRLSTRIQMIFQDPYASLNPRMTIHEIISEPLRLQAGGGSSDYRQLVAKWLLQVGLQPDHMNRYPHEFSGGQRQRIGIARALIVKPSFVICDEPISALDVSVQAQVINLLQSLKQELGLTLLFIAHDLSMVRYLCDRMAVMYLGSVVEEGPSDEVYFRPKHPYTQMLIASNPMADPRRERAREHQPPRGEIPSPINPKPGCRFVDRCPQASQRCHEKTPIPKFTDEQRMIACHLY